MFLLMRDQNARCFLSQKKSMETKELKFHFLFSIIFIFNADILCSEVTYGLKHWLKQG